MSRNDNLDCAKLLIEADKDCVNYTDFMWRTPLHLASVYSHDFKMMILLLENGADVNARYVCIQTVILKPKLALLFYKHAYATAKYLKQMFFVFVVEFLLL